MISITVNGKRLSADENMTVLEAARANGIYIPTLCAYEGLGPKAACRLCIVSIEGEDKEKLACTTKVKDGMVITVDSPELFEKRRETVREMFRQHTVDCHHCLRIGSTKAEHFDPKFCESCFFCDCVRDGFCELQSKALEFGIDKLPFEIHEHDFGMDSSTGSVIRNMDKCIVCRRCTDICRLQGVGILGTVSTANGRTVGARTDMKTDGCIRCGRCVDVCPTGALFMREHKDEILYRAHSYDTQTAALLCPDVLTELKKLYKEEFSYEQLVSALKKLGIDHVYSPDFAAAQSQAQAVRLLDAGIGTKTLILTDSYAAKNYLSARHSELKDSFDFFDSVQKCFAERMRGQQPDTKLIFISADNGSGAEAFETGTADYFVNARELYRILLRSGGAPARRYPEQAEQQGEYSVCGRYDALLSAGGWNTDTEPEELHFSENGRDVSAAICRNIKQAEKALENSEKYDVIKVTA